VTCFAITNVRVQETFVSKVQTELNDISYPNLETFPNLPYQIALFEIPQLIQSWELV
jgi:hypothetical protein